MGPLVWRFKTCSVITRCRQVVLLDAFAPWFSWHQRLTCRQAAAFPGSDLGASELVVSSRVPKCLHRIGSFGPQNGGQKARRQTRPLSLASPVIFFFKKKSKCLIFIFIILHHPSSSSSFHHLHLGTAFKEVFAICGQVSPVTCTMGVPPIRKYCTFSIFHLGR